MSDKDRPTCEVCERPIETGQPVVLGQESDGVTLPGIFDAGGERRLAMFHEEHCGWHERSRGHER